jgi:thiosulfate dehydrogenase (quinone) large subunit
VSYGWHFSENASQGWISSGFKHSPTQGFIASTHGPLAFIAKDLPTGLDDIGWMIALGGLGLTLVPGIFMRIAGWGASR